MWNQVYNPFNNTVLSTIAAAIPVVTLLVLIASGKVKAHLAAIAALPGCHARWSRNGPTGFSCRGDMER